MNANMRKIRSLPSTATSSSSGKLNSNQRRKFIISFVSLVTFCFIAFIEHILSIHKLALIAINPFRPSSSNTICSNTAQQLNSADELRILIGVLALPDHYRHREFLRRIYHVQPRPAKVIVDLKFVFCNLTTESEKLLIQLEIRAHNDIIILNCKENMDDGKTYTYFSSLPEMFTAGPTPPYHYVMKTDYDTFVRVPNLAESLNTLPKEDLYYGFTVPCYSMAMRGDYMSGMGYVLSWDIVEWISKSEIPRNHLKGPEDMVVGEWLKRGNKGNNSYNVKCVVNGEK